MPSNAEPLIDDRLRGAAWTHHGRVTDGAAEDGGSRACTQPHAELISLIGSVRLREEVAREKGAVLAATRLRDDHRAGCIWHRPGEIGLV